MNQFYVTHQGSQLGPFNKNQITILLKDKKLNWNDYLFDEKTSNWIHVMEHADFSEIFNKSFAIPTSSHSNHVINSDELKKRQWFILKENSNYGPFNALEVIQMLQSKTLCESDFIWKQGLEAWTVLSAVHQFSHASIKNIFSQIRTPLEKNLNQVFFRRKFVRTSIDTKVIIHDQKKIFNSISHEIGEGGAAFRLAGVRFEMGQPLYLHFSPAESVPQFNVISRVVSQQDDLFGVQFINIAGAAKNFISKLTDSESKKTA